MKRKLFLALVMGLILASNAHASVANLTSQLGVYNSTDNAYGLESDNQNQFTFSGTSSSIKYPYKVISTANTLTTLTTLDSGKTIVDTGGVTSATATAGAFGSKIILPRATPGLEYVIGVNAIVTTTVDTVDTLDSFDNSISGTAAQMGDSLKSTGQAGDTVSVFCARANRWTITAMRGAWTNNGVN